MIFYKRQLMVFSSKPTASDAKEFIMEVGAACLQFEQDGRPLSGSVK